MILPCTTCRVFMYRVQGFVYFHVPCVLFCWRRAGRAGVLSALLRHDEGLLCVRGEIGTVKKGVTEIYDVDGRVMRAFGGCKRMLGINGED